MTGYYHDALNRTAAITDALTNVTRYGYDKVGNQTFVTDTVLNTTRYDYDALNRVITTTNPFGKKQTVGYDAVGNVLTRTDELTQTTRYAYDKAHRVVAVTDPLTQTTRYQYDALGNTLAITSPMTQVTSFVYDAANRMTSKTTPIGATGYSYDNANNLVTLTDPSGATQNFTLDAINRVTQEDDRAAGGALVVSYVSGYDPNSNRTSETESRPGKPNRVTTYNYNKANWLVTTTDPNSNTTGYAYDAAGNRTSVSDALGITTVITPTTINLPGTVAHYQGSTLLDLTANTFDNKGNLTSAASTMASQRLTDTFQYNGNDYLTYLSVAASIGNGVTFTTTYQSNNLLSEVRPGHPYVYDGAGRLICRDRVNSGPGVDVAVWFYDAEGRRVDQYDRYSDPPAEIITCNRVLANPTLAFAYVHTHYEYNGYKLTSWTQPGNNADATYQYDGEGQVTQELRHDGTVTTTLTYTWEPATHRLIGYTRDNAYGVFTTTLNYDSRNRVAARYTSTYSTTYAYVGDTDWLLRETIYYYAGSSYDLVQYRYLSPKLLRAERYDTGPCQPKVLYMQMDWHGNLSNQYVDDGGGAFVAVGDDWGKGVGDAWCVNFPYAYAYRWNGQWGWMYFHDLGEPDGGGVLGLYYAHGRWYNPDTGLFLSPDDKGDYFYGGAGQDPLNYSWISTPSSPGDDGDYECNVGVGCSLKDVYPRTVCKFFGVCRLNAKLDKAVLFYSRVYGIPPDLLATTLVVEDMTDIEPLGTKPIKDWALGIAAQNGNSVGSQVIKGIAGLFSKPEIGFGLHNVHILPSMKAEKYLFENYLGSDMSRMYTPYPYDENQFILYLLTTEGNMRYASVQLRYLADTRKDKLQPHIFDLTDNDKAIIYGAYRKGIKSYALSDASNGVREFQTWAAPLPNSIGALFLQYLQAYKGYYR